MTSARTLKELERVWLSVGFVKKGRMFHRFGGGVSTFLDWQKGFGIQWHINVGFYVESAGGIFPAKLEHAHMYFRLEKLFPEFRETIISSSESSDALGDLLELFAGPINASLTALGTVSGLREGLEHGYLYDLGLVRKEVRNILAN